MKGKILDDPRLDRAYTRAYYAALHDVERAETSVALRDRADAFASLFEQELEQRDLSATDRRRIVEAFRENLVRTPDLVEATSRRRRAVTRAVGGGLVAVTFLSFLVYLGAARPFASVPRIQADLGRYLEQVDNGYGGYARRYYRTLDRFERRLGPDVVAQRSQEMHQVLDERFGEAMAHLQSGEVAYTDDALRWSRYYPDREERSARRQEVQNAALKAVGKKVDETMDSIFDRVTDLIEGEGSRGESPPADAPVATEQAE